jgi:hypothetical protein
MGNMLKKFNVLFLGGAKRISLGERFINAGKDLNLDVSVFTYDLIKNVPFSAIGKVIKGKPWNDQNILNHLKFVIKKNNISIVLANVDKATIVLAKLNERFKNLNLISSNSKLCGIFFDKLKMQNEFEKIKLGENPKKVYNVGGLNVESILRTKVLDKNTLEKKLKFIFMKKNLLVTFHPETIDYNNSKRNFIQLIKALEKIKDILFIFTYPNADKKNNEIIKKINKFTRTYKNSVSFKSMGRINYISTLNYIDGVIGNSSSGITEAPSFKIGTINIGDRQEGRIKSSSIIDCKPKTSEILKAIKRLYSSEFKNMLKNSRNPYANGLVSNKIINILNKTKIPNNLKKIFYENS